MAVTVLNEVEVTTVQVVFLFEATLDVNTIKNSKFPVYNTSGATPVEISDPFETITIAEDYNAIAKILTLTWNSGILDPNTDYKITLTGLEQPDGSTLDDTEVHFTTGSSVTPTPSEVPTAATPTTVIDYSLIADAFTTSIISTSSLTFSVDSTDPENGEYYIQEDYENGRVTIVFTETPAADFADHIKVQRKIIQRAPARWETISDVDVTLDGSNPYIYIDFPALDHFPEAATPLDAATPIHLEDDYEYFEPNYKYRIIVSKNLESE